MGFAQHDHMIQAFATDRADQPFHVGVLPRQAGRGDDILDTQAFDPLTESVAIDRIAVTDHVTWRLIERQRLDNLLDGPLG